MEFKFRIRRFTYVILGADVPDTFDVPIMWNIYTSLALNGLHHEGDDIWVLTSFLRWDSDTYVFIKTWHKWNIHNTLQTYFIWTGLKTLCTVWGRKYKDEFTIWGDDGKKQGNHVEPQGKQHWKHKTMGKMKKMLKNQKCPSVYQFKHFPTIFKSVSCLKKCDIGLYDPTKHIVSWHHLCIPSSLQKKVFASQGATSRWVVTACTKGQCTQLQQKARNAWTTRLPTYA